MAGLGSGYAILEEWYVSTRFSPNRESTARNANTAAFTGAQAAASVRPGMLKALLSIAEAMAVRKADNGCTTIGWAAAGMSTGLTPPSSCKALMPNA